MSRKILSVSSVELQILKSKPPTLVVIAAGKVPSTGWHDGRLIPYIYIAPPQDGIYDFDFVAEPPSGPAGDVVLPTFATTEWHDFPPELKGVRVHASSNAKERRLDDAKELSF